MKRLDTMSGEVLELRNNPENHLNDNTSERGKGENINVVVGYFDDNVSR